MTKILIELDSKNNKIVNIYKAKTECHSKAEAIINIITDWYDINKKEMRKW